jgi:hypothetical protein
MISCTSWSNIGADLNNSIRSFKFSRMIILWGVWPFVRKVRFRKGKFSNKKDNYKLDIQINEPNDLCFAAVFYYADDDLELSHIAVTTLM